MTRFSSGEHTDGASVYRFTPLTIYKVYATRFDSLTKNIVYQIKYKRTKLRMRDTQPHPAGARCAVAAFFPLCFFPQFFFETVVARIFRLSRLPSLYHIVYHMPRLGQLLLSLTKRELTGCAVALCW